MPPLAHAVCLIDDEQIDGRLLEHGTEAMVNQLLRRRVNKLLFSARSTPRPLPLARRQRAVDRHNVVPFPLEGIGLIFHQRDQRTDDNSGTFHLHAGQLEAQTLSRSRRHEHQSVLARQGRERLLLPRAEPSKPEVFTQLGR